MSPEQALSDALIRLRSSTWRVLGCDLDDPSAAGGYHEWIWSVEDGVGRRAKQVVVRLDRALEAARDELAEAPDAMRCAASGGLSVVEQHLIWAEPPDLVVMRPLASPLVLGGVR